MRQDLLITTEQSHKLKYDKNNLCSSTNKSIFISLIKINNIMKVSSKLLQLILFADDTNIFMWPKTFNIFYHYYWWTFTVTIFWSSQFKTFRIAFLFVFGHLYRKKLLILCQWGLRASLWLANCRQMDQSWLSTFLQPSPSPRRLGTYNNVLYRWSVWSTHKNK